MQCWPEQGTTDVALGQLPSRCQVCGQHGLPLCSENVGVCGQEASALEGGGGSASLCCCVGAAVLTGTLGSVLQFERLLLGTCLGASSVA